MSLKYESSSAHHRHTILLMVLSSVQPRSEDRCTLRYALAAVMLYPLSHVHEL